MTKRNQRKNKQVASETQEEQAANESVSNKDTEKEETTIKAETQTSESNVELQPSDKTLATDSSEPSEMDVIMGTEINRDQLDKMYKVEGVVPHDPFPYLVVTQLKSRADGTYFRGFQGHTKEEKVFPVDTFTFDTARRVIVDDNLKVKVIEVG